MTLRIRRVLNRKVGELGLGPRAITCAPNTPIKEALKILRTNDIGSVVVVEGLKVHGIFTERDCLHKVAAKPVNFEKEPVSSFMTHTPTCINKETSFGDVLREMRGGNFRHMIIVDSYKNVERVISIKDIMNHLIDTLNDLEKPEAA